MTELRQRKTEGAKAQTAASGAGDAAEKYIDAVGSMAPKTFQPYLKQSVPYARMVAEFIEAAIPVIESLRVLLVDLWASLQPYKPDLLFPAVLGLVMCFFGGCFVTLIAAAEAYNMCSHATVKKCFGDLSSEFRNCHESNKKDDKVCFTLINVIFRIHQSETVPICCWSTYDAFLTNSQFIHNSCRE